MHHRGHFAPGAGGQWSAGHAPPLGNVGVKFSKTSFPHFKTFFNSKRPLLALHNNLKQLILIILLCLQCSFSKMRGPQKEKLCILQYFSTFSFIFLWHVRIRLDHKLYIFKKYFFNFTKPPRRCRRKELLLQAVNFTGYRLIRRTL